MKLLKCVICKSTLRNHNKIGVCRKHRSRSKKRREYENEWKEKHKTQHLESMKKWRANNRKQYNDWFTKELETNVNYKIAHGIRNRLRMAVRRGNRFIGLGCTIVDFKLFLESKFKAGMNWGNYGLWEIDHIKPLGSFDLKDPKQFSKACNYKNTQPLWKAENLAKRKIEYASKSAGLR